MPKSKARAARGGVGESKRRPIARKPKPPEPVKVKVREERDDDEAPAKNVRKDHNHAGYDLEGSATRPSRKSTRRAANRLKPDSNLHRRTIRKVRSPKSRSQMRGA